MGMTVRIAEKNSKEKSILNSKLQINQYNFNVAIIKNNNTHSSNINFENSLKLGNLLLNISLHQGSDPPLRKII